ncbi:hypothetical protein Fleli_2771 [Bernardetia litoralis DSM 6794]|uniref:Uncharacterized protein n=1 Tax=Bernardetia litoralis (strain ATCC 23117 / DSM 6794 / NBRC 15988 / NCIMB 1366 / Fx l1 / Sio-4) TaxID=880071 RepID=I4AMD9_BERLS|nr:hypothetical protein [Bernardetia litoralis]AFM05124.1 hypothetical protein Fleli_2771 [Bernardetia litoralis DSM 6794]
MEIEYEIDHDFLEKSKKEYDIEKATENLLTSYLIQGKVIFSDNDTILKMQKVNLLGFFSNFLGGIIGTRDNLFPQFGGIGFWDNNGENGFDISMNKSNYLLENHQNSKVIFRVDKTGIEKRLNTILLDIISDTIKLCPAYQKNMNLMEFKQSIKIK